MALKANNVLIKSIEANNNTTVGTAKPITWKTPLDFADFDGENIWTDGDNIYFSFRTTHENQIFCISDSAVATLVAMKI